MAAIPLSLQEYSYPQQYLQHPQQQQKNIPVGAPVFSGGWKITVGNLSRQVSDFYLHSIFSPIGTVISTSLHFPSLPSPTGFAEVVFSTRDEARNALSLTGCSIGGAQITITHAEPMQQNPHLGVSAPAPTYSISEPEKRNLYVLNLPLDVSNDELVALFSPFGHVSHACVLAILDSCARRRGFILMGTGEEATRAMKGVHGRILRDYCVDVSFSVIQKTGHQGYRGPEDSLARHNRALSRARPPLHHYESLRALMGNSSGRIKQAAEGRSSEIGVWLEGGSGSTGSSSPEATNGPLPSARQEGTTLIVDNLCPIVFQTSDDLMPIFTSFGALLDLQLFPSTSSSKPNAAVVVYQHRFEAEKAKEALHGQVYSDRDIRVTLVEINPSRPEETSPSQEDVQEEGRFDQRRSSARPSPPSHSASMPLAPLLPVVPSAMAFDPFSPLSSPRPTRQAHPTHIQMPTTKYTFPPPAHSFVDTLTPRAHYSTSPFRVRPGVSGSSQTSLSSEVSSPETYVEDGNSSSPEGSLGRWFTRRASDASFRIAAGDVFNEDGDLSLRGGGKEAARGRGGMDELSKRVEDLAVDSSGTFVYPLLGSALADAL